MPCHEGTFLPRPTPVVGLRTDTAIAAHSPIWLAYMRLEAPPGLSLITTVGRYATVEAAQVATDEVWAARS